MMKRLANFRNVLMFLTTAAVILSFGINVFAQPKGNSGNGNCVGSGQEKVEVTLKNGKVVLVPQKAADALIKHAGAVLTKEQVFNITAYAGVGGSIDPSGITEVMMNDSQSFTIMPLEGYAISYLIIDGEVIDAASSFTFFDVTADHSISAIFTLTDPGDGDDGGDW